MNKFDTTDMCPETLKPVLEDLLTLAKKHGAGQAEAVGVHGRSLSVSVRGGALEDLDSSEGLDVGLRVIVDNRQACVSSSDVSKPALDILAARCVAMAKLAPVDTYCGLAEQDKLAVNTPALDVYDTTDLDANALLERARGIENAALAVQGVVQAEGANAYLSKAARWFVTSDGFSKGWRASRHGLSVAAFASDGQSMERDFDYKTKRFFSDLPDPQAIGKIAGERAVRRLGAQKMDSTSLPVIFHRRIASALLSSFASAISGTAIARGVSFLKDKMDEQIFSEGITISDDPHLKRGLGSHPWDGEGVSVSKRDLVKNGVLNSWLLNSATARQLDLQTTGHAERGLSSPPGVSASNLWLHNGNISPQALLRETGEGLLVTEMFGPSLNPNTGDYSVGVSGFRIEKGVQAGPVNEITIAGNLLDMYQGLTPANDLMFDEATNAPSLRIDTMVIAGA